MALLKHPNGSSETVYLPYFQDSNEEWQSYSFNYKKGIFTPTWIKIHPDDCIAQMSVNGKEIYDFKYNPCDIYNGVEINIGQYLNQEVNQIDINVTNGAAIRYGLGFGYSFRDIKFNILLVIFSCIFILLLISINIYRRPFLFFLTFGLTVRLGYIWLFSNPELYISSDMGFYAHSADALIQGNLFAPTATFYPSGYYIFLYFFYLLLKLFGIFGLRYTLFPVLNVIIGCLAVYFVYEITKKLATIRAAIIASFIYLICYQLLYLNIFTMTENLFIPLMLCSLYIIICKTKGEKDNAWLYLIGIVSALCCWVKPQHAVFIPIIILWFYMTLKKKMIDFGKYIYPFVIGFILIFTVMSFTNYNLTGGLTRSFSTAGGVNFMITWCDVSYIVYSGTDFGWVIAPPTTYADPHKFPFNTNVSLTNSNYYTKMGIDCIVDKPERLLKAFKSPLRVFSSSLFPSIRIFFSDTLYHLFKWINIVLLIPLSIIAFFFIPSQLRKYHLLLISTFLSLLIVIYLFNPGEERYLFPYIPIFIMLASIVLARIKFKVWFDK